MTIQSIFCNFVNNTHVSLNFLFNMEKIEYGLQVVTSTKFICFCKIKHRYISVDLFVCCLINYASSFVFVFNFNFYEKQIKERLRRVSCFGKDIEKW